MEFKRDEAIAVITVGVKDTRSGNFFSHVIADFADACAETGTDRRSKVLVVEYLGADSDFRSANDVNWPLERMDVQGSVTEPIAALEIPVLMGMDGYVLGQVLELALACDIRFATPQSRFGFPEIQAGIIPCDGGTQRLSRLVGKAKALEMMFTAEAIDSKSAWQIGLVNRILEREDLFSGMMGLSREMSLKSPTSFAYVKEAIHKGMDLTLEQGLRLEADLYYLMHTTNDRREGIGAFREKRKPKFNGS